jgi:hypothetical protein
MNKFDISLRITHPNKPSEQITKALGLVPEFSWTAGDRKTTPKGGKLPGHRKESYWCYGVSVSDQPLEAEIAKLNDSLAGKQNVLLDIVATGGRIEYFVGWFSSKNSGFVLKHELSRQLAELKIDLSFDVYPDRKKSS